jgi:hypothetical protein
MTAISLCCTKFGFAIAADSQSSTYDAATDTYTPNDRPCTKIFRVSAPGRNLAYAMMSNFAISEDGSFHLPKEIGKHSATITKYSNLRDYIHAVGYKVTKAYRKAWKSGRFDPWKDDPEHTLIARIIFAGCVLQKPSWMQVEIHHQDGQAEMLPPQNIAPLTDGRYVLAAPEKIVDPVINGPDFAQFRQPSGEGMSLQQSGELAANLIKACMTPEAIKIEPQCRNLGGRPHVATVTADEFQWLVEPEN